MLEIWPQLPVFTVNESSDRKSDIIFGNLAKNYICPENFKFLGLIWKNKSQPAATLCWQLIWKTNITSQSRILYVIKCSFMYKCKSQIMWILISGSFRGMRMFSGKFWPFVNFFTTVGKYSIETVWNWSTRAVEDYENTPCHPQAPNYHNSSQESHFYLSNRDSTLENHFSKFLTEQKNDMILLLRKHIN